MGLRERLKADKRGPFSFTRRKEMGKAWDYDGRPQKKINAFNSFCFHLHQSMGNLIKGKGKANLRWPLKSKVSNLHLALVSTGWKLGLAEDSGLRSK